MKIFGQEMKLEHIQDIGASVICDQCSEDYSDSDEQGGFVFSSHGVCPKCAPRMMESIKKYNEEKYIVATCPDGMSFRDFILAFRGGDNTIKFYAGV